VADLLRAAAVSSEAFAERQMDSEPSEMSAAALLLEYVD
jgi:hypothetical protein